MDAVSYSDLSELQHLLDTTYLDPVDVNEALCMAAEMGYEDAFACLLAKGANPEAFDSLGETPLIHAAINGHTGIINQLLEINCDVNCHGSQRSPLHCGVMGNHPETVKLLLDSGSDPNSQDLLGQTPLIMAITHGYYDIATLLMERGSDVNKLTIDNESALYWAVLKEHMETIQMLIENGAKINELTSSGATPLTQAVRNRNEEIVRLILTSQCDINMKDHMLWSALHWGACVGHIKIVDMLLQHGADLNAVDVYSRTPLHEAAYRGDRIIVEKLLAAGANPDARDCDNETPLIKAVRKNISSSVIKLLLQANCDVSVTASYADRTCSVFEIAALRGLDHVMCMLLLAGCDVSIVLQWCSSQRLPQFLLQKRELLQLLVCSAQSPRPLQKLCCSTIRKNLGMSIEKKVQELHLPPSLKNYLLLKDLDCIDGSSADMFSSVF